MDAENPLNGFEIVPQGIPNNSLASFAHGREPIIFEWGAEEDIDAICAQIKKLFEEDPSAGDFHIQSIRLMSSAQTEA